MQIFISHATADRAAAQELANSLEADSVPTWLAFRDILAGQNFAQSIVQAIEQCSHLLVLVTPTSIESQHVKREVNHAIDQDKVLIPVFRDLPLKAQSSLPEEWRYWLGIAQAINWPNGSSVTATVLPQVQMLRSGKTLTPPSVKKSNSGKRLTPTSLEIVFQVTSDDYFEEVIEHSLKYPNRAIVLMFTSNGAKQCAGLRNTLDSLVRKARDRWVLGFIDVDQNPSLAERYGAKFPPMVMMLKNGQTRELFRLARNEKSARQAIEDGLLEL